MNAERWAEGQPCDSCGIAFCHPHRPGRRARRVWVGRVPTAYHTSPFCGAAPAGVKSRARGFVLVELDLEGGNPEGVPQTHPDVPPGWKQVGEAEAAGRGLSVCLRC